MNDKESRTFEHNLEHNLVQALHVARQIPTEVSRTSGLGSDVASEPLSFDDDLLELALYHGGFHFNVYIGK